jgi:hypothetical protein
MAVTDNSKVNEAEEHAMLEGSEFRLCRQVNNEQ